MVFVKVTTTLDAALSVFRRQMKDAGILKELKSREYYVKPSRKRKLKAEAASRRKYLDEKKRASTYKGKQKER